MENKIRFGLSNVHIFPINSTSEDGKPTYGEKIKVPGAVALSLSPEGDEAQFFADDIVYWAMSANNGYSGDLELALIPQKIKTEILGQTLGEDGVLIESTDDKAKEFALLFEVKGDVSRTRFLFPRCTMARSNIDAKTQEKGIDPSTEKFSINVLPLLNNHRLRYQCVEGSEPYAKWYDAVYTGDKA